MTDLDYSLEISVPSGWLLLSDPDNGYDLDDTTVATISTTRRDRTIDGQWVEGTFTVASVKGNEIVPVGVWVDAPAPATFVARMEALKAAFDQLTYQIRETFDTTVRVWTCFPGQYTVTTSGPMRFARVGLLQAQVPRLPTLVTP